MSLPDVIRKMAITALEKGECAGPVWQIIAMGEDLPQDELLSLRVNDAKRSELVKGEKRLTNSYITNTCNRMRELQDADKSVSIRFGESETGDKVLTLRIKNGRMRLGEKALAKRDAEKRGARIALEALLEVSPAIDHLEGDQLILANEVIRSMRALIKRALDRI